MAVGALEPKFYATLLATLERPPEVADPADQEDRDRWPELRELFARIFATRTRAEWTKIFEAGLDADALVRTGAAFTS